MNDLERFKHIEPRAREADDREEPADPFQPPRPRPVPIVFDQRDADAGAQLRADRAARAAAAIREHEAKLAAAAPRDLVRHDPLERALGWQWLTAQSPRTRATVLVGGLAGLGLLALVIGPLAWAGAPLLVVVIAVSFLARPSRG